MTARQVSQSGTVQAITAILGIVIAAFAIWNALYGEVKANTVKIEGHEKRLDGAEQERKDLREKIDAIPERTARRVAEIIDQRRTP